VDTGNVLTRIAMIGVSREPPSFDSNGIPHLDTHDGEPTIPLSFLPTATSHQVEIKPLFPGNHYFFVVLVTDAFGNWDFRKSEFTTMRRKITVEFPTIHIYNDGDYATVGEAEFWFRVFSGQVNNPNVIKEFHYPQQDIDDWSETDRPYQVGFAHVGELEVVKPREQDVGVASWGVEEDGPLEADEGATNSGEFLPLPSGKSVEKVTNSSFLMDCPTSTVDSTFHYGVDVRWSVEYAT
jgi:hypothetical protein